MVSVEIKRGYNIKMTGKPSLDLHVLSTPSRVAFLPERIRFIKPRLQVWVGDRVKVGSVLLEDKRNTEIKFLSPGAGKVAEINLGHRRRIREIVIELDDREQYESFDGISMESLEKISRQDLIDTILCGGLWPLIRELPYRDIARRDVVPSSIFVNLGNLEPFQPEPEVYLQGKGDLFEYGLAVLRVLGNGNVNVYTNRSNQYILKELDSFITHTFSGEYPAHDPGVLLYRIKRSSDENHAWFIDGQDLLLLAELLKTGRYPTQRIVVLAGPGATERSHLQTRIGVPIGHVAQGRVSEEKMRYVVGGLLTGYTGSDDGYIGLFEKSLLLVPEGDVKGDLFDWAMPGRKKPGYSKTFLSALSRAEPTVDCNRHGGLRACISCNHCPRVCPVEILPQLTYKAILAGEVEEALAHGLLDCVECGLCSYVCPSKIELFQTLQKAKEDFYREIV